MNEVENNLNVLSVYCKTVNEWEHMSLTQRLGYIQLKNSMAFGYMTDNFYILECYYECFHEIVACVNRETNTGYDFSRMVYGYTQEVANDIYMFFKGLGVDNIYIWKAI